MKAATLLIVFFTLGTAPALAIDNDIDKISARIRRQVNIGALFVFKDCVAWVKWADAQHSGSQASYYYKPEEIQRLTALEKDGIRIRKFTGDCTDMGKTMPIAEQNVILQETLGNQDGDTTTIIVR